MTDEIAINEVENQQNQPLESETEIVETQPVAEKMLKQSEVNKIAARTKHEAYEKGMRDARAEHERQRQAQPESTMGGMSQMSEDGIRRLIEQEAEKRAHMAIAQKIAGEFQGKMEGAKIKYADFDDVVSDLDLPSIPHLVQWANDLDNTGDIIYDIAKNPSKFANILTLSATAPHLAQKELRKLSDSIKRNEEAKGSQNARDPLSQLKPSTNMTDTGALTVKELRNQPWLRG
jgi:hypothetical protein